MTLIRSIGIDPSTVGTCFFELQINTETMSIVSADYYLFNKTQKLAKLNPHIIYVNPKMPTYAKIDETISYLDSLYLQSNIPTVFTVERLVPNNKFSTGEDWKAIYHLIEHYLRRYKKPYTKIYPVSLKKYATGYGHATKDDMGRAFDNGLVKLDLSYIPDTKNPKDDPKSNVWDSHFLAEIGYYKVWAETIGVEEFKKLEIQPYKKDFILEVINTGV